VKPINSWSDGRAARIAVCLAVTLVSLAVSILPATASARGRTSRGQRLGACSSHRSRAVKKTARVLVWKKQPASISSGQPASAVVANTPPPTTG
jgi:hypothetical protein